MDFCSVITPLVTPFTEDGKHVDESALRALVDMQIDAGVGGLISCGTTGEFTALTNAERRTVSEIIADQARGRVPLMVHVGSTSTETATRLAEHAATIGADGLMVAPPYYGSLTEAELMAYYHAVGTAGLPMCIYNIPAATGVGMGVELILSIAAAEPTVAYVKDSTGDLTLMTTMLTEYADVITVLCGEELLVAPGLLLGLKGAVLGCANVIAPGLVELFAAGTAHDLTTVQRLNAELMPLMQFIVRHPYCAAVKEAMSIIGHPMGPVRPPLLPLPREAVEPLVALLHSASPDVLVSGETVRATPAEVG